MTKTKTAGGQAEGNTSLATTESVAEVLERERDAVIHDWMTLMENKNT